MDLGLRDQNGKEAHSLMESSDCPCLKQVHGAPRLRELQKSHLSASHKDGVGVGG